MPGASASASPPAVDAFLSSIPSAVSPPGRASPAAVNFSVRDLDRFPHGHTRPQYHHHHHRLKTHSRLDAVIQHPRSHRRSLTMALHAPQRAPARPPPLRVDSASISSLSNAAALDYRPTPTPKTPGSKITSFFGWKSGGSAAAGAASPGNESSSTEISDSVVSPMPSPMMSTSAQASSHTSHSRDSSVPLPRTAARSLTMPVDASVTSRLADMEHELQVITSELAGSIRREMDLEDLVERLQLDQGDAAARRSSDYYFSDSGNGSVRAASTDDAASFGLDGLDRLKRNHEQERARLRHDLSQRWQDERARRQTAESHVQLLESQISQFRREKVDASNVAGKSKELEAALEDTRRRLTEERHLKDNMEDLLTGMRVELEQQKNELEQRKVELQQHKHELQQHRGPPRDDVQALLSQPRKPHPHDLSQSPRIDSIAEEVIGIGISNGGPGHRASAGLSRSNSLARIPPVRNGVSRSGSLSRPASMIVKGPEFHESLVNQMKDVETQRDALHQTVKSLLERQAYQARQHEKRLRLIELELHRARQAERCSPRKRGYEQEVKHLREEINLLRRRADDALDQKWQCEKGLAGLKMDLDRAEQETGSLRALLQDYDILVPSLDGPYGDRRGQEEAVDDFHATASSLEQTYEQLRLDKDSPDADAALEAQIRQQVVCNASLRARLTAAISQGEHEQKLSALKINEMQSRLRTLEETLMAAQQRSEEEVHKHEQEIASLTESHNAHLLRAKDGIRSPLLLSPVTPGSPSLFASARSPRLSRTSSGEALALNQVAQTENLERRVRALEQALRDADDEMGEVVSRMNSAQMQVAELQSDRDEALRQTRRLQAEIRQRQQ